MIDCCGLNTGGSGKTESKEECYQSLTKEGYYVLGSDPVPKFNIEFDYKEPEDVPPCLIQILHERFECVLHIFVQLTVL